MYDMYFIDGGTGEYLTFEGNTYIGRVETIEEGKDMYPEYFV